MWNSSMTIKRNVKLRVGFRFFLDLCKLLALLSSFQLKRKSFETSLWRYLSNNPHCLVPSKPMLSQDHSASTMLLLFFFTEMPEVCQSLKEIVIMSSIDSGCAFLERLPWKSQIRVMRCESDTYEVQSLGFVFILVPHFSLSLPRLSFLAWGDF